MSWHFVERWLQKVYQHSTLIGKFWITFLIVFRIVVVSSVSDRVYSDEQSEFRCNTGQVGCGNICFNQFSPMSHIRFWSFQIIMVSTPTILFMVYSAHQVKNNDKKDTKSAKAVRERERENQRNLRRQSLYGGDHQNPHHRRTSFNPRGMANSMNSPARGMLSGQNNPASKNNNEMPATPTSSPDTKKKQANNTASNHHISQTVNNNHYHLQNNDDQQSLIPPAGGNSAGLNKSNITSSQHLHGGGNLRRTSNRPPGMMGQHETNPNIGLIQTAAHHHPPTNAKLSKMAEEDKQSFMNHFVLYTVSVILRTVIELLFMCLQWYVFGWKVATLYKCVGHPCPNTVDCYVSRPWEKTILLWFMYGVAAISTMMNLVELNYLLSHWVSTRLQTLREKRINLQNQQKHSKELFNPHSPNHLHRNISGKGFVTNV